MNKGKKDKEDIRLLGDVLSELKDSISNIQDQTERENLGSLIDESIDIEKSDRKIIRGILYFILIIITFFIASIIYIVILGNQRDNLQSDLLEKRNIINRLQWSDSVLNTYMEYSYDTVSKTQFIQYRSINGKALTYEDLANKNDSLMKMVGELVQKNKDLGNKVYLAESCYDIKFIETDKSIIIEAPHLDSALILLPYYRKKIKHDDVSGKWIIEYK